VKLTGTCNQCSRCCSWLSIEIHPEYHNNADIRRWVNLHHVVTHIGEEGRVFADIPIPCSALTEDGRCGIYEDRPQVCRVWPTSQADLEDPRIKDYCSLSFVSEDETDLLPMIERRTG
jgi:Fe-S-cluster containining protein